MPCGCGKSKGVVSVMNTNGMLQTYDDITPALWGPHYWTILHSLAERAGSQENPLMRNDERNEWERLVKNLEKAIPCDECRGHYKTWITTHPFQEILALPYEQYREAIKSYWYDLHTDVNRRLNKPNVNYNELSSLYEVSCVTQALKDVEPIILGALRLGYVTLLNWKNFVKSVKTLVAVYGIYK